MKNTIKLEELAMFLFSIYLFNQSEFSWWYFPALILIPDIGMIGYLINPQVGAVTYNLFHHKAIAIFLLCLGWYIGVPWMALSGIILFGHASMDRIFGYGLKFPDSFHNTHLGNIGK